MVFTPDMENMFGKAHGGALFALIDEAFETAGNSHALSILLIHSSWYIVFPVYKINFKGGYLNAQTPD
jgi:acyl-coenzyme A thioesterase PaaI-like protein